MKMRKIFKPMRSGVKFILTARNGNRTAQMLKCPCARPCLCAPCVCLVPLCLTGQNMCWLFQLCVRLSSSSSVGKAVPFRWVCAGAAHVLWDRGSVYSQTQETVRPVMFCDSWQVPHLYPTVSSGRKLWVISTSFQCVLESQSRALCITYNYVFFFLFFFKF